MRILKSVVIFSLVAALSSIGLVGCSQGATTVTKPIESSRSSNVSSSSVSANSNPWNGEIYEWNIDSYPDYIIKLGEAELDISTMPEKSTIKYSDLDELGRTQAAYATLTSENRKNNERGDLPDPTGWPESNPKVIIDFGNGKSYKGYFWNRSHLIADSLSGDEIIENEIAGTRMQNVGKNNQQGGMAYTEEKARKYLDSNENGIIYYAVAPIYKDDELIPRATVVDILSDDSSINEKIYVFNCANGYSIDYHTGEITETVNLDK